MKKNFYRNFFEISFFLIFMLLLSLTNCNKVMDLVFHKSKKIRVKNCLEMEKNHQKCKICQEGYRLTHHPHKKTNKTQCKKCQIFGCSDCKKSQKHCKKCKIGFFEISIFKAKNELIDHSGVNCSRCLPFCDECDDSMYCRVCEEGLIPNLKNTKCVPTNFSSFYLSTLAIFGTLAILVGIFWFAVQMFWLLKRKNVHHLINDRPESTPRKCENNRNFKIQ